MPRNYENGFMAYVTIAATTPIKYGYRCRLEREGSSLTELGITKLDPATINAALLQGFVLGCNAPKPNRATKIFSTEPPASESTFCSSGNVATARAAGWKVRPGRPTRKANSSSRSQTWYVTVNGINYAWQAARVPTALAASVNLTEIGVKVATPADTNLIFGCSFPKPARVAKILNDAGDRFSTFTDPSVANLPSGWVAANNKQSGRYGIEDLRAMI